MKNIFTKYRWTEILPIQFHLHTDFNTDYSKYYFLRKDEIPVDTKDIVFGIGIDEYRYPSRVLGKIQETQIFTVMENQRKNMMVLVVIIVTSYATYEQVELLFPCYKPSYALCVVEL